MAEASISTSDSFLAGALPAFAYMFMPAMRGIIKHGIAEKLRSGPATVEQLVHGSDLIAEKLRTTMDLLASVGLFDVRDGRYVLNKQSELFFHPGYAPLLLLCGHQTVIAAWGKYAESLRSERSAFYLAHGEEFMDFIKQRRDPEFSMLFDKMLEGQTVMQARAVLEKYEFSNAGRIVDVGGLHGGLVMAILQKHSNLHGVLFDLPAIIVQAQSRCTESSVADRLRLVSGDFFASVPEGNTLLLKLILHDWLDEEVALILRNCRKALRKGDKLLVIEHLPTGNEGLTWFKCLDATMLVLQKGRERSESEYRALLERAEFSFARPPIQILPNGLSIIEAIAA